MIVSGVILISTSDCVHGEIINKWIFLGFHSSNFFESMLTVELPKNTVYPDHFFESLGNTVIFFTVDFLNFEKQLQ